jgi:hypothetical protein
VVMPAAPYFFARKSGHRRRRRLPGPTLQARHHFFHDSEERPSDGASLCPHRGSVCVGIGYGLD